jgi:RNA polymerase sigma factor (sigma-70 family)
LNWGLNGETQQEYSAALLQYMSNPCSDQQLRIVALRYHQDHAQVQALLRREHANHDTAWAAWHGQVVAILRHAGLAWSDDVSVELEDLAQIARAELARALPSFRYASRFSTWAHQVITQSMQRHIRDRQALKRAGKPTSLEQARVDRLPIRATDRPEAAAHARVLATLINDILTAQPDPRLAKIFQLWTQADMRAEQIGQHTHLSASQVRVLLARTRELLQSDPAVQAWHTSTFGGSPE